MERWGLLLLLGCFTVQAAPLSPHRNSGESFEQARDRSLKNSRRVLRARKTALDSAKKLKNIDFAGVTSWPSEHHLMGRFARIRDERFLESNSTDLIRRISWLYPDDGCFARAAMARQLTEKWNYAQPSRIFVFGSLEVETENSPKGKVSWWYHTAPLVEVEETIFVIDPAIDAETPLLLEDWILKQVDDLDDVRVNVCDPYTYDPSTVCKGSTEKDEEDALFDQRNYLIYEYRRQKKLGRDPEEVLGDTPPWK